MKQNLEINGREDIFLVLVVEKWVYKSCFKNLSTNQCPRYAQNFFAKQLAKMEWNNRPVYGLPVIQNVIAPQNGIIAQFTD